MTAPFELSAHAQEQIADRSISIEWVQQTLTTPGRIHEENGLKVYQSKFVAGNGKTYLLRVFVNDSTTPPRVVTVYKTSKVDKYWR